MTGVAGVSCAHTSFSASVDVVRTVGPAGELLAIAAHVVVVCAGCGTPLRFVCPYVSPHIAQSGGHGQSVGHGGALESMAVAADRPCRSPDGMQLTVQLVPPDDDRPGGPSPVGATHSGATHSGATHSGATMLPWLIPDAPPDVDGSVVGDETPAPHDV